LRNNHFVSLLAPVLKKITMENKELVTETAAMLEEKDALANEFWVNNTAGKTAHSLFNGFLSPAPDEEKESSVCFIELNKEDCAAIRKLCSGNNALIFNFYATAFSILLGRYFSLNEITFLSPYGQFDKNDNNRQYFLFRSLIEQSQSFKEAFSHNKVFLQEAFRYKDTYEGISSHIGDNSIDALLEVGLSVNCDRRCSAGYWPLFYCSIEENTGAPSVTVMYHGALCSATGVKLFLHNMKHFLQEVISKIYQPLHTLSIHSDAEKALLAGFNSTAANYPLEKTMVEIFEAAAEKNPDNTAVVFNESVLDYKSLNKAANRFAAYLVKKYSIKKGDFVCVKAERSEWMLVAVLGIFKSGAVYIPIDPEYPDDRIAFILADSCSKVVVDDALLEDFRLQMDTFAGENPPLAASPDDLAYIIYTSGSTGTPKGVMVEHLGMLNHLLAKQTLLALDTASSIIQNASQSFDISIWQFFAALLGGGKVFIYGKEQVTDPSEMIKRLEQDQPSVLEVVPSFLDAMLDVYGDGIKTNLDFLKYMVVTGEELKPGLAARWFKYFPDKTLINAYGPTEASDDITHHVMQGYNNEKRIPVGKTVANLQIYITDNYMNLCPVGVKGEICVSGPGVGRGYLNNAEKTRQAFSTDPFCKAKDTRMYKTGDIGRYLEDGSIEFFGRKDEQLKIRGNRIEPGEIEAAVQACENIEGAVVVAVTGNDGQKELAACITASVPVDFQEIRNRLGNRLPAYMIPAVFVQMKSFPLTPNGKIDKKKLIAAANKQMQHTVDYVPPRNETEQQLVQIWKDILGKEKIGIKDNFFELGGHSLRATRLAGKIYKEFEVKISLKELFTAVTAEQQGQLIQNAAKKTFIQIPNAAEADSYPLSAQQLRLWLLCQFEDAASAYNIPRSYLFEGDLDPVALNDAFTALLSRHEILRTVFQPDEEDNIGQYILPPEALGFKIAAQDIRHCTKDEQNSILQTIMQDEVNRPFDLAFGPLLRAGLIQVGNTQWVFTCVMHHIISDGWSMDILFNELTALYAVFTGHDVQPLANLRIQYKDYVHWQQEQLSGENLKAHRAYWINQFEGELPVLEIPAQKQRPAVKTYNGDIVYQTINATAASALNTLAQKQGGSLFMSLLAVVNTLLYKFTGQDDIIIGTPVAGREHTDLESQIGFYINTLALRTRFRGENSFNDLLEHIKNITLDAYEHQVYPFDQLVDELSVHRDISRSAVFDVMIILQNTGKAAANEAPLPGPLAISAYDSAAYLTSKFDLTFNFAEINQELQVGIEYNTDIYSKEMIERMAACLLKLAELVTEQPHLPIKQHDYLDATEKKQLLQKFNPAVQGSPVTKTITALFEERAEKTPGATALIFEGKTFTYGELNEQANKLAAYLREKYSIIPNDIIGIKSARNEWMIISMLGVLKSGAAYVPVDTDFPEERITYLQKDSGCKLLIDEAELGDFRKIASQFDGKNPACINAPDDLAYVIYTSGSTGNPKGVMIEHRSVVDFFGNFKDRFFLDDSMVLGAVTNYTFDISVLELLGSLVSGIKLLLIAEKDPEIILQHIAMGEINALQLTPSRLYQLLEADNGSTDTISLLQVLLVGGEALGAADFAQLKEMKSTKVLNVYGPTETTIWSSSLYLGEADALSIGKPLLNENIYIADDALHLCPVGVTGEICIGGRGVARGYLNNAGLTAEKFVANPWRPGERMYRTGDLGRWQPDGSVLFMGRKDDQVKIQGYRIEPGEIEAALQKHPDIITALVIAKTAAMGRQLTAYIKAEKKLQAGVLSTFLSNLLPAYMVPSYFVQLEEFPLTSSGKTDRKKLAELEGDEMYMETPYVPPGNETEEKLTIIWQEILGKEKIGIRDNFFTAGGNSLTAIRVLSRVRNEFRIDIRVEEVFNNVTIESLAQEVARKKWLSGEVTTGTKENTIMTI
jgi:tyrocidine synthetase III